MIDVSNDAEVADALDGYPRNPFLVNSLVLSGESSPTLVLVDACSVYKS